MGDRAYPITFLGWVNSSEQRWVISSERLSLALCQQTHGVQAARPATAITKSRWSSLASASEGLEGLAACVDPRKTRDGGVLALEGLPALLDRDLQEEEV